MSAYTGAHAYVCGGRCCSQTPTQVLRTIMQCCIRHSGQDIYIVVSVLFRVPVGAIGIDPGTFNNAYSILSMKKDPGSPVIGTIDGINKT